MKKVLVLFYRQKELCIAEIHAKLGSSVSDKDCITCKPIFFFIQQVNILCGFYVLEFAIMSYSEDFRGLLHRMKWEGIWYDFS
jgi:hypothetical protein